jgi:CBS domain containing-hemolysin-like protein
MVMKESAHSLSSEERVMIDRVMDLQNLKVLHVAIPLAKAVSVSIDTPLGEVLDQCRRHGYSRMPVWQVAGNARRIVGLLSMKSFLYTAETSLDQTAGAYVTQAHYLSDDLRLETALRQLQRHGQRMAIVLGPDKRETGIISMQDILRAIFGEVSL